MIETPDQQTARLLARTNAELLRALDAAERRNARLRAALIEALTRKLEPAGSRPTLAELHLRN